ncbi:MAG TPA: hypothetical protein VIS78_09340, partial [Blastocatellia bacterium]
MIAGGSVLLLVIVIVMGGIYVIRSGRLNHFIIVQVQRALADYGVRAEVGGLDLTWGVRTAKAHDIKLYNQQTDQLIATLDDVGIVVETPHLYALRLKREIIFKTVDVTNLQAYVEIDAQGRTNFDGLHNPPP